jgi:hypothetical protein
MGGMVYDPATGQWVAAGRQGSGSVTRSESGQVTDFSYTGQSAVAGSGGNAATAQTYATGQDLGSGQGSVSVGADVQTKAGGDYSVDATATKGQATVTATDNTTGTTKTATVGDGQVQNAPQQTTAKTAPTSQSAQKAARTTSQGAPRTASPTAQAARTAPSGSTQAMAQPGAASRTTADASARTAPRGYSDDTDVFGKTGLGQSATTMPKPPAEPRQAPPAGAGSGRGGRGGGRR